MGKITRDKWKLMKEDRIQNYMIEESNCIIELSITQAWSLELGGERMVTEHTSSLKR